MDEVLYKLAPASEVPDDAWRTRLGWTSAFVGDPSKSFINLYTAEQLAGADAAFAGRADVMLLAFNVETMREEADLQVKFEAAEAAAGGTGDFAHVHGGPIPYACLHATPALLALGDGGKHVFPPLGAAAAAGAGGDHASDNESDSATDDGMEPFDQHRFDEDD